MEISGWCRAYKREGEVEWSCVAVKSSASYSYKHRSSSLDVNLLFYNASIKGQTTAIISDQTKFNVSQACPMQTGQIYWYTHPILPEGGEGGRRSQVTMFVF